MARRKGGDSVSARLEGNQSDQLLALRGKRSWTVSDMIVYGAYYYSCADSVAGDQNLVHNLDQSIRRALKNARGGNGRRLFVPQTEEGDNRPKYLVPQEAAKGIVRTQMAKNFSSLSRTGGRVEEFDDYLAAIEDERHDDSFERNAETVAAEDCLNPVVREADEFDVDLMLYILKAWIREGSPEVADIDPQAVRDDLVELARMYNVIVDDGCHEDVMGAQALCEKLSDWHNYVPADGPAKDSAPHPIPWGEYLLGHRG